MLAEEKRKAFKARVPKDAEDAVKYLWKEVQPTEDFDLVLARFSESIYYEDFNFKEPFCGLAAVRIVLMSQHRATEYDLAALYVN